jgi:hypothetical protein
LEVENVGDVAEIANDEKSKRSSLMDIAGAKALKERLGGKAVEEDAPTARPDVHEDAPPVYHWTGVSQPDSKADRDDAPADSGVSKFLRLGLSFR